MKRIVALTVVMMFSACTQTGNGVVQQGTPNPDPKPDPKPDPVITTPINSRFVGKINAAATGGGQNATYDFESILEFREKQAGKLIGYSKMWDQLQTGNDGKPKLIVDYWAQGQRSNADVELSISLNSSCADMKLKGKMDESGDLSFPKIVQKLGCGFFVSISVTTEATVFTRDGEANKFNWTAIETHFAPK
jgi:hypothetical protein